MSPEIFLAGSDSEAHRVSREHINKSYSKRRPIGSVLWIFSHSIALIYDAEIYHLCILAKPLSKDTRLSGDEDTIIKNYKLESHVKTTCSF